MTKLLKNEWDEWRKAHEPPKPPPAQKSAKQPSPKRPITQIEIDQIKRLRKVRFAGMCNGQAFTKQYENATLETMITDRQAWYIQFLWYKYRRQLGINRKNRKDMPDNG